LRQTILQVTIILQAAYPISVAAMAPCELSRILMLFHALARKRRERIKTGKHNPTSDSSSIYSAALSLIHSCVTLVPIWHEAIQTVNRITLSFLCQPTKFLLPQPKHFALEKIQASSN
jgi:hypothetical protein